MVITETVKLPEESKYMTVLTSSNSFKCRKKVDLFIVYAFVRKKIKERVVALLLLIS